VLVTRAPKSGIRRIRKGTCAKNERRMKYTRDGTS